MAERTCPVCARTFYPRTGQHRYCTPVCRERAKATTRAATEPAKYGSKHQKLRRALARQVRSGGVPCSRCGEEIEPGEPWDLDHADSSNGYLGPAHQACNRGARRSVDPPRAPGEIFEADGELWRGGPEWNRTPQRVSRKW